jgi:Xaa-Pro aminopeptidase
MKTAARMCGNTRSRPPWSTCSRKMVRLAGISTIVASGPNATTLHYEASTRQMKDGELLLTRCAANYATTTEYTDVPDQRQVYAGQKDIYETVLRAQEEGIKVAVKGATLGRSTRRPWRSSRMACSNWG